MSGRRWMGVGSAAALIAACAAAAPSPAGGAAPRQTASVTFTTTTPGAPTGVSFAADWTNPDDPNAKPYAVDKMVFSYPRGMGFDFSVPEQCKASDAQLEAQGSAACPAGSRVASGTIVTDSGSDGGPVPRFVNVKADNFNNQDELIGVGDATNVPVIPGFSRTVTRSTVSNGSFTTDFPDVMTGSPPDGYDALKTLRLSGGAIVRGDRAYLRTPPTCPADRAWTTTITFIYHDGVQQTVNARSPCRPRPGSSAPPAVGPGLLRLRVHAAPRHRCASRRFSIRASVIDSNPLRRLAFFVDGRRIRTTTRKRFRLHVSVARVRPGRHVLSVVARDVRGATAKRSVRMRRCR